MQDAGGYEANPSYPPVGEPATLGWDTAAASLPPGPRVLAVVGPAILDWDGLVASLLRAVRARGVAARHLDLRTCFLPWAQIVECTASAELPDDPDFTTLSDVDLADLFGPLPSTRADDGAAVIVTGPGAALTDHDVRWYEDQPKTRRMYSSCGWQCTDRLPPPTVSR